ncbi:MAG: hypothetical protein HZA53_04310 [Planctomycetes bacterium]|nr:hypothetical protein [Planctomycetota bacterium]
MRAAEKRWLRRVIAALVLGITCGWVGLVLIGRAEPEHAPAPPVAEPAKKAPTPLEVEARSEPPPSAVLERERAARVDEPPRASKAPVAAETPRTSTLRARLVDVNVVPIANAPCLLVPKTQDGLPRTIEHWKSAKSDAEGRVEFRDFTPGFHVVCFTPSARPGLRYDLSIPPGLTDLEDVEFDEAPGLHELVVRLDGPGFDLGTQGTLHLWSRADGAVDRWSSIGSHAWMAPTVERNSTRAFGELPAGQYALSFEREDRAAEPEFRELEVPCDPIVFELAAGGLPLRVIARSAAGTPVPAATVVLITDRHAAPFVAALEHGDGTVGPSPGERWRWAVLANGFVPRMGVRADFQLEGGELVLRVELAPGDGALVIARDATPLVDRARGDEAHLAAEHLQALASVTLAVGGHAVVKTDDDGIALCPFPSAETVLELTADGRALVDAKNLAEGRVVNASQPVLVRFAAAK